jgi:hypothetical protein
MSDFVELYWKRNRGWPSPDESWGLGPMFGDDGWCRSCGMPLREQCGPLTLRRRGLSVVGAWVPNWQFDAICLEESVAKRAVAEGFSIDLREVAWPRPGPGRAFQIVAPSVGRAWFDAEELSRRAENFHGVAGATCPDCGRWRWMPITYGELPPVAGDVLSADAGVIASPEWFGDGCRSFRQVLVRRGLAELIAAASPRDFTVRPVT